MNTKFAIITEDVEKLPIYLFGIGDQDDQEEIIRPSGFAGYLWVQTLEGVGKLIVNKVEYELQPGMVFVLSPGIEHQYYSVKRPWKTRWFSFGGKSVKDIFDTIKIYEKIVFELSNPQIAENIIEEIYRMIESEVMLNHLQCSVLLYSFLTKQGIKLLSETQDSLGCKIKQLEPVIKFMDEGFNREINLDELASKINVTPSYLCRIFHYVYSTSPLKYLNQIRIQKSKEKLLTQPQMSVEEISKSVGFKSTSYFCNMFKKQENCTPMRFRNIYGH